MKWTEALTKIKKPAITNRDAAGLINFARAVWNTYGHAKDVGLKFFDWYAYALPALGWFKQGDKFKTDATQQLAPYPTALQLWEELNGLASDLDRQGVAFKLPIDPRGTDAIFRKLAGDAWGVMQVDASQNGVMPPEIVQAAQAVADAGKAVAEAAEGGGGAAPAKKKAPAPSPSKPKKTTTTNGATNGGGTGGGAIFALFLLAVAATRKRRGRN